MKSKAPRKRSKDSSPSKPKEFRLTQSESSEWESILADFDEIQAQALDLDSKQAAHNAHRVRFWARVCKRLGIRSSEVDTAKPVRDTIYLKPADPPANRELLEPKQNPQHKQGEGEAK